VSIARILWTFPLVLAMSGTVAPAAAQSSSGPIIRVELGPADERYRQRITSAVDESLTQLSVWLGPFPHQALTVRGAARPETVSDGQVAVIRLPWLSQPSSMDIERQVARAVAMQYWPAPTTDPLLSRGIAAYLEGRIVERLFNLRHARPGHSAESGSFFGGYVPWAYQTLRLTRWSRALDRPPAAVAFLAVEHQVSWPVLQGALEALAAATRRTALTREQAIAAISAAAGQDVGWLLHPGLDGKGDDYAVTGISSVLVAEPCPAAGCVKTSVVVARRGLGPAAGQGRVQSEDLPRDVPIDVSFSDGQRVTAMWDARSDQRVLEFESPAPPQSARLDRQGALVLDRTRADHVRYSVRANNVPVGKWASRWMVWLQNALLTYTMFL
jgi:hypothetical protein